jgi:hypothetical protein
LLSPKILLQKEAWDVSKKWTSVQEKEKNGAKATRSKKKKEKKERRIQPRFSQKFLSSKKRDMFLEGAK